MKRISWVKGKRPPSIIFQSTNLTLSVWRWLVVNLDYRFVLRARRAYHLHICYKAGNQIFQLSNLRDIFWYNILIKLINQKFYSIKVSLRCMYEKLFHHNQLIIISSLFDIIYFYINILYNWKIIGK